MYYFPLIPCLNTITAGLFALLLLSCFLVRKISNVGNGKEAPTAGGAWPVVGHLPLLAGNNLPYVTLGSLADKLGPVFRIRLGMRPVLVVSSSEMAKECFTTNDAAVASRPKIAITKYLTYNFAAFGFAPYGAYWREMRKITMVELLSNRRLELLKHVRASEVETRIKDLHELWREKKDASGYVMVEMKQWFWTLCFNVIMKMITGNRYNEDEDKARRWTKASRKFFELGMGQSVVSDAFPFLEWLDIGGHIKNMKKTLEELDSMLGEWLEEHKQKEYSGDQPDFMDVLLSVLDDGSQVYPYDTDTIVKATSLLMIAGGSDPIMVTLIFTISLLLNNRHIMKKVQDELKTHIGDGQLVKESDISKLTYLQATVKESMRLYPNGPMLPPREFIEDCVISGYHVKKGTQLFVNVWKIQTDSRVWSDPLVFNPERFLTTHKDVDVRGQHFDLIPFGTGRRQCPGISLGLQMVHLVVANILHAFEISTPSGEAIDMTKSPGLLHMKSNSLEVLLKPRLS